MNFPLDLANSSDSGLSNSDNLTNITTPTFTGSNEPNSTILIYANSISLGQTSSDESGFWSFTVPDTEAPMDGAYLIQASVRRALEKAQNYRL